MSGIPQVTLPSGDFVSIFSDQLYAAFATLPPGSQRKTIRHVEEFLDELHANGSLSHLVSLGYLNESDSKQLSPEEVAKVRETILDRTAWQLTIYLRHSTPSRISEALAPLTFIVETCKRINGSYAIDVVPTLFLAVCLSRIAGEEEAALQTFKQAFLKIRPDIPPLNIIWARANKARLLRHMHRTAEAELEENFTRQWVIRNQSKLKPSLVRSSLSDDVDTGAYILDHPDVVQSFQKMEENDSSESITTAMIKMARADSMRVLL
ncbi:hypothetical protein BDN70DRAFT_918361 [Pholiota conissans]|uniref:Uncharacterized protein n=1 Tax=Pholiota conissans TaxID=109636 RepID=A0A9P6CXX6_9AGAR|nr:hypothetical protein BDN70DRAFT_918361 [Pholiota conissans]